MGKNIHAVRNEMMTARRGGWNTKMRKTAGIHPKRARGTRTVIRAASYPKSVLAGSGWMSPSPSTPRRRFGEDLHDPFGRLPVPQRRPPACRPGAVQGASRRRDDLLRIAAHELIHAQLDGDRPLGVLPEG